MSCTRHVAPVVLGDLHVSCGGDVRTPVEHSLPDPTTSPSLNVAPAGPSGLVTPCTNRVRVLDDDFRWLYHLLEPVGASGTCLRDKWRQNLKEKVGGVRPMPFPEHDCPDITAKGVEVGTCMGGGIGP